MSDNNSSNKYDDSANGGYSYEEKLGLVASGKMDPKTIDLASAEDARLVILGKPKEPDVPKLGDFFTLEASVIPIALRARWARQDEKIIPPNPKVWEADWCEAHKDEISIQGVFRSGTLQARVGATYTDMIAGFVEILRNAADMLEKKYAELKETDPNPVQTRDEVMRKLAEDTLPSMKP